MLMYYVIKCADGTQKEGYFYRFSDALRYAKKIVKNCVDFTIEEYDDEDDYLFSSQFSN